MLSGKSNSHRFFLPVFSFSLFFFVASLVQGAEVQLTWTPNSETNLDGYKVHYGTASRDYTEITDVGNPAAVDNQIVVSLSNFSPGTTYYLAATAYDADSVESDYSAEAVWTCPLEPVDPPTANDMTLTIAEDTVANGRLDGTSQSGLGLSYEIINNVSHGTVSLLNTATGEFSYTPGTNFNGMDIFAYKVSDDNGESEIATVSVDVKAVNDTPVAQAATFSMNQNEEANGILVGSDIDSSNLTYSISSNCSLGTLTMTNAATGAYRYTANVGAFGEDEFQFKVTDDAGAVSNTATVSISINQVASTFIMEMGTVTINKDWQTVELNEPFTDPVVIAKPASHQDENPCVVRMRNVTATGFEIRLQNWDYLADDHGAETVSFVAVERGSFEMSDGTLVEAGSFETDETGDFVQIFLAEPCNVVPVVSASIITDNGSDAVVGRIKNVSATGFKYGMQEQEANEQSHALETINYIAWEPSSGMNGNLVYEIGATGDEVTGAWKTISFSADFDAVPLMIADMQTRDGGDTANLRYNEINASQMQIKIAEEQSNDTETYHTTEIVGFMAFAVVEDSSHPAGPGLEAGLLQVDTDWQRISFNKIFVNPVLIARIISQNDDDPCIVRLNNIDADGFDIRLQEWDYQDGVHGVESVSYIVMEQGSYTLDDGTLVEAGHFSSNATLSFENINFNQEFNLTPVVTASIASFNEIDPVTGRMRNISTSGLSFNLQEEEANGKIHAVETISYIAWEPSSGIINGQKYEVSKTSDSVKQGYLDVNLTANFGETPLVLADMQTADGGDTSTVRCDNTLVDSFSVRIEEEQSEDTEIYHTTEVVGYMAIAGL